MPVKYLPSAQPDLVWFSEYYTWNFPEGGRRAADAVRAAEALLNLQPFAGPPLDEPDGLRILRIKRTPFSLIYRVSLDSIEIVRVWDTRQQQVGF